MLCLWMPTAAYKHHRTCPADAVDLLSLLSDITTLAFGLTKTLAGRLNSNEVGPWVRKPPLKDAFTCVRVRVRGGVSVWNFYAYKDVLS